VNRQEPEIRDDDCTVVGKDLVAFVGMRVEHKPGIPSQGVGTVTGIEEDGAVTVTWDNAKVLSCRIGREGEYWLIARSSNPQM